MILSNLNISLFNYQEKNKRANKLFRLFEFSDYIYIFKEGTIDETESDFETEDEERSDQFKCSIYTTCICVAFIAKTTRLVIIIRREPSELKSSCTGS